MRGRLLLLLFVYGVFLSRLFIGHVCILLQSVVDVRPVDAVVPGPHQRFGRLYPLVQDLSGGQKQTRIQRFSTRVVESDEKPTDLTSRLQ